jgi:large subunit ribosomal protein L33
MSQDTVIKLQSTESGHVIHTRKNKKKIKQRLELKKYDPILRKHVAYKETR